MDPFRFRKGPGLWSHAFGEKGDHLRVERVGLGQAAHRAGEVADLARVDDAERQPDAGQGRRNSRFEAAGRLQDNKGDGQSAEAADQVIHPLALSWNTRMPRPTV